MMIYTKVSTASRDITEVTCVNGTKAQNFIVATHGKMSKVIDYWEEDIIDTLKWKTVKDYLHWLSHGLNFIKVA